MGAEMLVNPIFIFCGGTRMNGGSLVAQMVKESACNAGDLGLIPGSRRSPVKGNGYPLQYANIYQEVDMLDNMIVLWLRQQRICLQCRRPGCNPKVMKIPWSRKWQRTLVFLPGELHGQRSLVGYSCKESDMTEHIHSHTPVNK